MSFIDSIAQGVRLRVYVQPSAPRTEIAGVHDGRLKIKVKAPPVGGQANEAVEEFLAKLFNIAKSNVSVTQGLAGRTKTVEVVGVTEAAANAALAGQIKP
jgi:uncharacterized protein (TIGR00251 family)